MGLYFNPGNENFAEISKMEWYVDKTKMLTITNSMIGTAE